MKMLQDIKEDLETQQPTGVIATAEAVKGIRAALPDKPQSELTADDVSAAMMDENSSELLQQLAKQLLTPPGYEE